MTTATLSLPPKPNALILQQAETKRLEAELQYVNRTYYEMSQHRNRIDVKDFEEFYRRQQDRFIESIHVQAELKRSQAREAALERVLAKLMALEVA